MAIDIINIIFQINVESANMITEELIVKMVEFNEGDPKRIQHFLKVYEFAHIIGVHECIDKNTLFILDVASIMHDIGIRPSEEKYGKSNGKLQEQEGPQYAREMLENFVAADKQQGSRPLGKGSVF